MTTSRGLLLRTSFTYLTTVRTSSRYGEVMIFSGHGDPELVPLLAERDRVAGVELDRERLEGVRAGRPRVGDRAHRGLVHPADQDDRVHARRQHVVGLVDRQLLADHVVVATDRPHQQEQHDHRRDRDPRSLRELRDEDHHENGAGHERSERIDRPTSVHGAALGSILGHREQPRPMSHHAGLAQGEGHEHTHDVQLDQASDLGVEGHDEDDGEEREEDDAIAECETVAAGVELAREIAVASQDGAEHRETVESGVGGQEQDQTGRQSHQEESQREVIEDDPRELTHDGVLVVVGPHRSAVSLEELNRRILRDADVNDVGQRDDRERERRGHGAEDQQRRRCVTALGLAKGRHPVRDRLDTGECRAS